MFLGGFGFVLGCFSGGFGWFWDWIFGHCLGRVPFFGDGLVVFFVEVEGALWCGDFVVILVFCLFWLSLPFAWGFCFWWVWFGVLGGFDWGFFLKGLVFGLVYLGPSMALFWGVLWKWIWGVLLGVLVGLFYLLILVRIYLDGESLFFGVSFEIRIIRFM